MCLVIKTLLTLQLGVALVLATSPAIAASQENVTISAVGDIMMGTNYPTNTLPADGGKNLFKYSKEYIKQADIRFGNLEGTLFDGEKGADGKAEGANRYLFRTPTAYGALLADAGFNVLSLANNHALDFGAAGIKSTREILKTNGIQFSSKSGKEVVQFDIRGIKVALIACDFYSGHRSLSTPESTYKEIQKLKESFDIVIVSVHAGGEGKGAERVTDTNEVFLGENRGNSVLFAHTAIDMGASVILMHGPHVARGLEIYKNKLIAYSLGNFTTGRGVNIQGYAGAAPLLRLQIDRDGNFIQGHLASFHQVRDLGAVYDKSAYALRFINKLSELDFPYTMPQFNLETGGIYPR